MSTAEGLHEMKSRVADKQRLSAREMTVGKLSDCNAEKRRDCFVLMEASVGVSLSQQRSQPKALQVCHCGFLWQLPSLLSPSGVTVSSHGYTIKLIILRLPNNFRN
jgi:hypothetical protein